MPVDVAKGQGERLKPSRTPELSQQRLGTAPDLAPVPQAVPQGVLELSSHSPEWLPGRRPGAGVRRPDRRPGPARPADPGMARRRGRSTRGRIAPGGRRGAVDGGRRRQHRASRPSLRGAGSSGRGGIRLAPPARAAPGAAWPARSGGGSGGMVEGLQHAGAGLALTVPSTRPAQGSGGSPGQGHVQVPHERSAAQPAQDPSESAPAAEVQPHAKPGFGDAKSVHTLWSASPCHGDMPAGGGRPRPSGDRGPWCRQRTCRLAARATPRPGTARARRRAAAKRRPGAGMPLSNAGKGAHSVPSPAVTPPSA